MHKDCLKLALEDLIAICRINTLKLNEDMTFWETSAVHINECLQRIKDSEE